jgi:hypothetical protein
MSWNFQISEEKKKLKMIFLRTLWLRENRIGFLLQRGNKGVT